MSWYVAILFLASGVVASLFWNMFIRWHRNRPRQRLHHVRVKSAHGVVTKLVLNSTQYEQFTAFLSSPDGIFEISDERVKVFLERRYVATVEVRMSKGTADGRMNSNGKLR